MDLRFMNIRYGFNVEKRKKKNREENIHQERKVINALLIATDNN